MLYFIANSRDGASGLGNPCSACCCEMFKMMPGETNALSINYSTWVIPMNSRGLTVNTWFDVEKITPDATGENATLSTEPAEATTATAAVSDSLVTSVNNPSGDALTFRPDRLYGPSHGTFELEDDGEYTYTPNSGFNGVDRMYYEVTDGVNKVVGILSVAVGNIGSAKLEAPAAFYVTPSKKSINPTQNTMTVPITVDPTARIGDNYRLHVRQEAYDCDGNKFYHVSCYDGVVSKC